MTPYRTHHQTTRTHPRSLAQAFPDERAQCIEGPPPKNYGDKAVVVVCVLAIWFLITLIAMGC